VKEISCDFVVPDHHLTRQSYAHLPLTHWKSEVSRVRTVRIFVLPELFHRTQSIQ